MRHRRDADGKATCEMCIAARYTFVRLMEQRNQLTQNYRETLKTKGFDTYELIVLTHHVGQVGSFESINEEISLVLT